MLSCKQRLFAPAKRVGVRIVKVKPIKGKSKLPKSKFYVILCDYSQFNADKVQFGVNEVFLFYSLK